ARGGIRIAAASGCSLYASPGTLERLGTRLEGVSVEVIAQLESRVLGPFTVTACHTIHDAVEPLALAVTGPAGEKTALAYDLGRAYGGRLLIATQDLALAPFDVGDP